MDRTERESSGSETTTGGIIAEASGPAEPIVTPEGDRYILRPCEDNPHEAWNVYRLGEWRCQRCETTQYLGLDRNGDLQEPHECPGCERQGPFVHVGELSDSGIEMTMQAGQRPDSTWFAPSEVCEERHDELWGDIRAYIEQHWATDDDTNYDLLTAWAMSTWFRPNLDFSSHLYLSGRTTGGKTTLLNTLARVSYRTIVSADATPSSMFRMVDSYNITYLVSEYHGLEQESQRMLDNVIRAGQKRNEVVTRSEQGPTGGYMPKSFNPFTHAAVASQYEPDDDIVNRCIQIHSSSPDESTPLGFDEGPARDIRNRMLHERWRLHDSEEWDAAFEEAVAYCEENGISHRTREKVVSLLTVAILWNKQDEFEDAIDLITEDDQEAAAQSEDANITLAIRDLANEKIEDGGTVLGKDDDFWSEMKIYNTDITRLFNDLTGRGVDPRWISHRVRNLGFEMERDRDGSHIHDDDLKDRLEHLCDEYGFDLYETVPEGRIVREMPGEDWFEGICDECGEKDTMRFKHTDGYTMCVECGTDFKEHRRDG
jgi:hypothetical protein